MKSIGPGLFMIALGAILKFAITYHHSGVNLGVIGVILMIVGVVAVAIGIAYTASRRRTDIVHEPGHTRVTEPRSPME